MRQSKPKNKDSEIYSGDKMLVRKTGIGIYATIDSSNAYVPQAVFIYKLKKGTNEPDKHYELHYFLGLLNSRLMLYYYYKKFGELEWKSFPYVTPKKLHQLPLFAINFSDAKEKRLHDEISKKVKEALQNNGPIDKELDLRIESKVMELYGITPEEKMHIWSELDKVQKLRIIRETMGSKADEDKKYR